MSLSRTGQRFRKRAQGGGVGGRKPPPVQRCLTRPTEGRRIFGCILVVLWLPFGSLGLTFGSLWLPFGSLLAPFGSLLVPFGSLWVPLAIDFLTFGASWRQSSYFLIFLKKISCKIIFLKKKRTENQIVGQPNRDIPKNVARTSTGSNLSLVPRLSRPGAEHLPLATY